MTLSHYTAPNSLHLLQAVIRTICILVVSLICTGPVYAQHVLLTGTVADASVPDMPLPGATIITTAAGQGTASDQHGKFTLRVDTTLIRAVEIRYIGYKPRSIELTSDLLETGYLGTIYLQRDPFTFTEVIITTSPSGRSANYQPAKAYNSEQLQRMAASSFGNLLDGEPGVSMRSFGSAPARPVIRGLDGDRVLIVENGERMGDMAETAADHAITLDPLSADRIEVVRGPASLLYGSSALGGVINLFNNDIPEGWIHGIGGSAALQGASVNNELAGFGRIVYGTGNGAFTSRLNYRTSANIRTPGERLSGTFNDQLGGSAGYTLRHGEDSHTGFSVAGFSNTYGLPDALDSPEEQIEIRMRRYSARGRGLYYSSGFFNRADIRFNASIYNHKEVELDFVPGGTYNEELELEFTSRSANTTMLFHHGDVHGRAEGAIGINAGYRELNVGGAEALTPDMRSFILAGLIFEELRITPVFSIQMGLRAEYQYLEALPNNDFDAPGQPRRTEWVASGSVGANWKPAPDFETGFQIARAYRLPRLEELYSNAPHLGAGAFEIGNPDLKNETGLGSDLFLRYRSRQLYLEAAVFYNYIRNFVTYTPTGQIHAPSGLPVFVYDATNAELFGGELNLAFRHNNITLTGGLDYVHGNRIDSDRKPLPFMPPLRSKIGADYDALTWFAAVNARMVSSQKRVAENEEATSGYILLTLEGGIRISDDTRHSITFRIDNALNRSYRDHLSRIEDRNKPMPGRGATITYNYKF
ncbi:MAG: TonB-dependent receptor [Balneolaceae bacterium]|nr:MAG: TonB-dependent receptor [Balneolaceae bacterium]